MPASHDWDWSAAGRHFGQALAVKPSYARSHAFYPLYLSALGRFEESLAVAKHALDLDPASSGVSHVLAVQLYLARQFDQSIQQCYKTLELDPNYAVAHALLGQSHSCKGAYREALPHLEKCYALSRGGTASLALLGYAHARLGDRSQALRMIGELSAAAKQTFVSAFFSAYMRVWKTRMMPSPGSTKLARSGSIVSPTRKLRHSGTPCAPIQGSPNCFDASTSHRRLAKCESETRHSQPCSG